MPLPDADRAAILTDWDAEAARPVPPDMSAVGCTVAILTVAVAAGLPPLLRVFGVALPAPAAAILLGTLGVAFAWGVFRGVTGKSRSVRAVGERAADALGRLAAHPEDRGPEARRAAVALIANAWLSNGPSTIQVIDVDAARDRLGAALPFVVEVEEFLLSASKTYPVFTA